MMGMGPHYGAQPTVVEREAMKHKGCRTRWCCMQAPLELDLEIVPGVEHDSELVDRRAGSVDPWEHTFQGVCVAVRRRRAKKPTLKARGSP